MGVGNGTYAKTLGSNVELKTSIFGAGTEEIEALFAGAIDAGYIGPNPAVNGYVKSKGEALRIVAGATSGGAALVVKPDINGPEDLKGKVLATPSLGNTQDVALRAYLKDNGLSADTSGGGDVSIHPQDNSQTLEAFKADTVQGAWVPEPWATRLVVEGGGKVLVDEATLWPEGKFATTELIVSKKFLDDAPRRREEADRGAARDRASSSPRTPTRPSRSRTSRSRRSPARSSPTACSARRSRTSRSRTTRSRRPCSSRPPTRTTSACSTRCPT